jgi:CheY-like chemotaxis protein
MPQKLLLADDSVTVQRVIELTFADEGMTVIAVGDGRQAIERIEKDRPDIILADVTMPERDGYEVATHVKNTEHLAHIPVVLMTGAFEQIDEARARTVGCDGVLAKPFEPHMVIALVRQLLDKGEPPASVPAGRGSVAAGYPFEVAAAPATSPSLDDYFDRLDEALSAHQPAAGARTDSDGAAQPGSATSQHRRTAPSPASGGSLADAFSALLADELGETPPSGARHAANATPTAGPATGDTTTRAATGPTSAAAPTVAEALVDEVTRRVIERLADRSVRDIVSATVLEVAERLVREEIERIKSSA